MIISVASGKGGTGKTTISTNLAISLGDQCTLLDCDVEEPNAHLFLHPRIARSETVTTFVPEVDEERCTFCRKCADICRFRAIAVVGKKVLVFPQLCHSCGGCQVVCPEEAIMEGSRELGVVEWGEGAGVAMIQGRLRVGEAMSPPLIKKVRSYADPDSCRTVIIDAPPGTSCPVIAAMRGVDYVLLVTEPTPFGLHDLRLAVGAVKVLAQLFAKDYQTSRKAKKNCFAILFVMQIQKLGVWSSRVVPYGFYGPITYRQKTTKLQK